MMWSERGESRRWHERK